MSETEELRRRMSALETDMDALREQITNTRALVAINDRDVAEFRAAQRAQQQVLMALRETQIEQGQRIIEQGQRIGALETEMRNGFATVLAAVQAITDRLPDDPAAVPAPGGPASGS